jgi:membrane protease YdiL (CAAX protease family)
LGEDSSGQSNGKSSLLLASPWHTLIVLTIWGVNAYFAVIGGAQSWAGLGRNRPSMYFRTMLFELGLLAVVAIGVRLRGVSQEKKFGTRWRTVGQLVRELGLGILLMIAGTVVSSVLGGHQSGPEANRAIEFLLPQNSIELLMWIALSITAGICEEAIYRGYFQGQFARLTGSVPAGIVISGLLFGGAHLYQGFSRAFVIFVSAILFGVVAHWRGTVRPGMFAHGIQDAIAPWLIQLMHR